MSALLHACGTPRVLAPRTPPPRSMPAVGLPPEPPAQGFGRVVIDATDGPMSVVAQHTERFAGAATGPTRAGPLCQTPCVVDLPLGRYTLYFSGLVGDSSRGDIAHLEVHPGLNVVRRAPGKYETPEYMPAGPIALIIGGSAAAIIGVAMIGADSDNPASGAAVATAGVGLTIAGGVVWPHRATQQDGATTAWRQPLQPSPAAQPSATHPLPVPTQSPPPPTVPAPDASPAPPGVQAPSPPPPDEEL